MKPTKVIIPLGIIAALALIAYPLYAHCGKCAEDGKTIVTQLDQNRMTLAKFITTAETHSKGRAISVVSELDNAHKLMVEVYCIAGEPAKIQMCQLDGATGSVLGMKEVKEFPITPETGGTTPSRPTPPPTSPRPSTPPSNPTKPSTPPPGPGGPGTTALMINNQTVSAACGACIYKMSGVTGCPLAVKIDGKTYLVQGANWSNHDYCDRECQAVVTGKIEGDKFICTKLTEKKDQPS